MKKTKSIIISALVAAFAVCLCVAFSACGSKEKDFKTSYGYGEEGVYYYSADADTDYLMSLQSGTYMISVGGVSGYTGTYSYNADENKVSFKSNGGETFEASFADDAMQLAISGQPYTFLRSVDETVTFMDGNSVLGTRTVTYGKSAVAIDGEKSGYIFLGWYEDKDFTTPYKFNTSVTGNLTLYARYIEEDTSIPNFDVKFIMDGEVIYETRTQNGVVYDFPEEDVYGWWVSATNSEDELTYKYTDETLKEATNLYAVESMSIGASAYADKVTWEQQLSSVAIAIDGEIMTSNATGNSYAIDLSSLSAGRHEITVSSGSMSETVVYMSKTLSRVSNFEVYGNVLVYNKVENAQYYYISVECANPAHDHAWVYNGNTLTYDFSNCEMGAEGIKFTVYAYASGYINSVSETFVYLLRLDAPDVEIDSSSDTATWATVAGATGYEVYIGGEYAGTVLTTEYSLKYLEAGYISVAVRPIAPGYYSEESKATSYTKIKLPAPEITGINEYTVSWSKVDGATDYVIYINGERIATVGGEYTSVSLIDEGAFTKADSYVITVRAINSDNANQNSQESDPVYATDDEMSALLVYENGVVYWQYAMSVGTYYVTVNDGDETAVEGKNSFPVTFDHAGENVIKVYFKTEGNTSAVACLTVTAYAIVFDTRGGNSIDTIYVAKGDTLILTTPEFEEGDANFAGWYTLPDLVSGYDSSAYMGDGYLYESGMTFTRDSTLILYASWLAVQYTTFLDPGMGVIKDAYGEIIQSALISKNSDTFTLPVPTSEDVTYIFYGWYSQENGKGTRYTDEKGYALRAYDLTGEVTLYAYWRQVVKLSLTTYHGENVLSASKGEAVSEVSEITIPAAYVYDGTEYAVAVINASAFNNCSKLVTINIPDTIQSISITNNGYESGAGAFSSSAKIENVNIYATGDEPSSTKEVLYYSEDGVLFYKDETKGYMELIYYPQGRTITEYTVPSYVANYGCDGVGEKKIYELDEAGDEVTWAVQAISTQVFRNKTLSKITIPSSVVYVQTQAFYQSNLKEVMFAGDAGNTLTIEGYAFQSSSSLKDVTLPGRLSSFESSMFSGCTSLENVKTTGDGAWGNIDGVLTNSDRNTIIYYPIGRKGEYATPEGVTTVGESAFSGHTGLTGITIENEISTIKERAFYGCTYLTSVTFENDENAIDLKIESQAFYGCTALRTLTLPSRLTSLAAYSFGECRGLTEVTYNARENATGETLSGLENFAFSSYGSTTANSFVETLNLGAYVPEIEFAVIFGGSRLSTVNIDSENANFVSEGGVVFNADITQIYFFPKSYSGSYVIPETVTTIGGGVFAGARLLTSVTIPLSVTEIEASAFLDCTSLTSVVFETLSDEDAGAGEAGADLEISDSAFSGCTSLTKIELPRRLTALGDAVFSNCTALEEITVAEGSTSFTASYGVLYELGDDGETPITLVVCPINNKCSEIVIYSSITSIADGAFENNKGVKEIRFNGAVDPETFNIGLSVFANCANLQKITLPKGITTIEVSTFANCTSLKEIVIPSTVTKIEKSAFYNCKALETVTFDGEVERDENLEIVSGTSTSTEGTAGAFYNCTSLKNITVPEGTKIGNYTFYSCTSLGSFIIPESTQALGDYVFYNTGLVTIELPANLASITTTTFANCYSLTAITVEEESQSFTAGEDGVLYALANGVATDLWIYPKASTVTTITVPASVANVKTGAFTNSNIYCLTFADRVQTYGTLGSFSDGTQLNFEESTPFTGCSNFHKLTLPEGLTEITNNVFANATFQSVVIPSTVTKIGTAAFKGCSNLEEVIFTEGTSDLTFESNTTWCTEGAFMSCTSLKELNIPDRTVSLGAYMCYNCSSLEKVTIGSKITVLPDGVFCYCPSLATVDFGEDSSVTTINYCAFYYAGPLDIELPSSVTTLGTYVFENSAARRVKLDENITAMGREVFCYCYYLEEANIPSRMTVLPDYMFFDCYALKSIDIPQGVTSLGAMPFYSCTSLESVNIPSGVTLIPNQAFCYCYALKNVTFKDGNTNDLVIDQYAFYNCYSLETIDIPARVTSIGYEAFMYCYGLTSVTFNVSENSRLSSIGDYAFAYSGLTSFSFPESTSTISLGTSIFGYCYDLASLHISSKVTSLGSALSYCYSITSLTIDGNNTSYRLDSTGHVLLDYAETTIMATFGQMTGTYEIPSSVETINANAFQSQSLLTKISIPESVTTVGDYAFDGCYALTEVEIASGASIEMGSYVFQNCIGLVEIGMEGVTTVGTYTFSGCSSLIAVDCSNLTTLGANMFYNCTSLQEVTLSGELTTLPNYMFSGCSSLKTIDLPGSLTFLGQYTFQCSGLEKITIPENVGYMGASQGEFTPTTTKSYVFADCESLEEVVLSSGMKMIGAYAFQNDTSLKIVTYTGDTGYNPDKVDYSEKGYTAWPSTLTRLGDNCFENTGLVEITVPTLSGSTGDSLFLNCKELTSVKFQGGRTIINKQMFSGCTALKDVDLENSDITSFGAGNQIFSGCTSLEYIDLSKISTMTGTSVFNDCTSLKEVVWGSVASVPESTFQSCESLAILKNTGKITTVKGKAFYYCYALDDWSAFSGVTSIAGTYAFAYSGFDFVDLTSIATMNDTTSGARNAFEHCENLEGYIWSNTVATIPQYMFCGCSSLKSIDIPSTVKSISSNAFQNCSSIVSVDLRGATGLTSLPSGMFDGWSSLVYVNLGNVIKEIPSNCFRACSSLLDFEIPDTVGTVGSTAFNLCTSLVDMVIPATVTSLGQNSFKGCTNLVSVEVLGAAEINTGTFYGCTALERVVLNDKITSIGQEAFRGCSSLKELTLPSSLTTIGANNYESMVFYGSGLESITIPAKVTHIYGDSCFAGCANLARIDVDEDNKTYRSGASGELIEISSGKILSWPAGYQGVATMEEGTTMSDYTFFGCAYITGINFAGGVTSIPAYSFQYCYALESITIPSTVVSIGEYAFAYSGLKSITIPVAITSVGAYAFDGCALEVVTFEGGPATIGEYAFAECESLATVIFSDTFTPISNYMFYGDTALTSVTLPESLVSIGEYAFAYTGIKSMTIPTGVSLVGQYAFAYSGLAELEFKAVNAEIGTHAFAGCGSLTKVTVAEGVTSLGDYMFAGCEMLRDVTLSETLASIADGAFSGCVGLVSVTIPDSVRRLGVSCFEGCAALKSVELGKGLTTIETRAFAECVSVEYICISSSVVSVETNVFDGWGGEQTIYIALGEYYVNAWWTLGWSDGCEAIIVYDYAG